ncbi:hypothetical protein Q6332_29560, partial [Klebsiella pneumoniae]|nr:hypothetical protein [Klebsiella pneumoniae]
VRDAMLYRWIDYQYMDEAQEREHMLEAIRILTELTGERLGLFHDCGVPLMLKRFPNYMAVLEEAYANAGADCRVVDTENNAFNTN